MDLRGIGPMGMSKSSPPEQTDQTPQIQPGEYKVGIDQGNMDAGIGALKDAANSADGKRITGNVANMSDDAASMTRDAAGTVHSATTAANAIITTAAAPSLIAEQGVNATVNTLKALNAAPGAIANAARRAAANADSTAYIEKYGLIDGRTIRVIKSKNSASLSKNLSSINANTDKYKDTLDKIFYDYRNKIKCREKLFGDLYYSNRGDPTLYEKCAENTLENLNNIREQIGELKNNLETKTVEIISEITTLYEDMNNSVNTISDVESYKSVRQNITSEQTRIMKLIQTKLAELKIFYDIEVKVIKNVINTKLGGRKSKKTRTTKKRKTLRKKRT